MGNVFEYGQREAVRVTNVAMIEMKENYFGFPIDLPVVLLTYQRGSSSCREPVTFSQVKKIEFIGNMAVKADWTLVEVDHSFSQDLGEEKVKLDKTSLLLPCQCQDLRINNNSENVRHLLIVQTRQLSSSHSKNCILMELFRNLSPGSHLGLIYS